MDLWNKVFPGVSLTSCLLLAIQPITYYYLGHYSPLLPYLKKKTGILEPYWVRYCCTLFKFLQGYVSYTEIMKLGGLETISLTAVTVPLSVVLVGFGQYLNYAVFQKLGVYGVFYGNVYGYKTPWVTGFPYNVVGHPQYVGVMLTVLGIFVLWSSQPLWYVMPVITATYYLIEILIEYKPSGK